MKASKYIPLVVVFLWTSPEMFGQFTGNSISEYQLGNIPDIEPNDLSSLYNQINLQYRHKNIKTSTRLEHFYTNDSINRDYLQLTQWQVNYRHKKLELKAGHFFETLGRGLLLRSFEIPASVKEERLFRVRHGFYRDVQGASFKYKGKVFRLKALYGKPLQHTAPPGSEFQRTETVEAVQPELFIKKQNLGIIAMRHSIAGINTLYSSAFIKGVLPHNFSYYTEYARNLSHNPDIWNLHSNNSYGTYLSINHSYGSYGSSIELKKFQNFLIGSGITDPPTLVKEHSYKLLNRSTHLPELQSERGYQAEVYYTFNDGKMITVNHAMALNSFLELFRFTEWFTELYWPIKGGNSLKTYIDYSKDEIIKESNRFAGGIYYTHLLTNHWLITSESEVQHIDRDFTPKQSITNVYLSLGIAKGTQLGINLYYEFSDDRSVTDLPNTIEIETSRHFYGIGGSYRPNHHNSFTAFIGERRGGPACTSGVCYEVLDFRGLELRWTSKF